MADKTKELLAVLDLPKEKQQEWYRIHYGEDWGCKNCLESEAFRLRDEMAKTHHWREAKYIVGDKTFGGYHEYRQDHESTWDEESQPIHWIVASLIAKELTNEGNDRS